MTAAERARKLLAQRKSVPISEFIDCFRSLLTDNEVMLEALESLSKYSSVGEECGCLSIARSAIEKVRGE